MIRPIPESELIINPDGSIYHLNLKPGQVADSIITVGDPDRVEKITRYFDKIDLKAHKREFVTHTGWYKGKRLSVMSTGMGTDNIDIFLTELDALFNVDFSSRTPKSKHTSLEIVRVGTSGSMQESIPAGTLLASAYGLGLDSLMVYYHLPQHGMASQLAAAVREKLGLPYTPYCVQASGKLLARFGGSMQKGITVTCPGFFGPQGRKVRLEPAFPEIFNLLGSINLNEYAFTNFEMETAGYYALGKLLGHEVLSLNAIVANRINQTFISDTDAILDELILHTLEKF
jgi:uridine phosphorylase